MSNVEGIIFVTSSCGLYITDFVYVDQNSISGRRGLNRIIV